jgi:hypothetical protein
MVFPYTESVGHEELVATSRLESLKAEENTKEGTLLKFLTSPCKALAGEI